MRRRPCRSSRRRRGERGRAGGRAAEGSEQRFGTKRGGRAAVGVANRDMGMGGARWTEAGRHG
jgi:hypothetical protein